MYKYRVVYYVDQNMERPVEAFLDKHPRVKVKVLRTLMNIEEYGLSMAIPHIKRLTGHPFGKLGYWVRKMPEFFMLLKQIRR